MTRTFASVATAAALAASTLAIPTTADARPFFHRGFGPAIVGGLAAGAVLGAFAAPRYYGGPYYAGYYDGPYGGPYAYNCPARRVWGPYGWHWSRVCY